MSLARHISAMARRIPPWSLYLLGSIPAALHFYWAVSGQSGPDPVKALEHALGKDALHFFIASLAVTPLFRYVGINLISLRRAMGLMAFAYMCLHFATYLFLDLQTNWAALGKDLTKRPYIIVGTLALLLLVPVAASSNDWSIRRLGAATWGRVHSLVYPAVILAAVHFIWQAKAVTAEIVAYSMIIFILLIARVHLRWRRGRKSRGSVTATG